MGAYRCCADPGTGGCNGIAGSLGQCRDHRSLDGVRLTLKPSYQTVHGMLMPLGFPLETLASSFEFTPDADDVVLATYPKCGTTWMQNILYMLYHEGREIPSDQSVTELVPHLEEMGADFVRARPRPRPGPVRP